MRKVIKIIVLCLMLVISFTMVFQARRLDTYDINLEGFREESWYIGWLYSKKITIDHKIIDDDLLNFPVLVIDTISDTSHVQSDGNDFLFTMDNVTKLNHEIEEYNSNTGELIAWVNVTAVSSTVDTIFYMYYGNYTCGNQENLTGTWDSNFIVVSHMNDAMSSSIFDSTDNTGFDGSKKASNEPIQTNGMIGFGQKYDGLDDYIKLATGTNLNVRNKDYTWEVWGNSSDVSDNSQIFCRYPASLDRHYFVGFGNDLSTHHGAKIDGDWRIIAKKNNMIYANDNWHYLAFISDRDASNYIYKDGVSLSLDVNTYSEYDINIDGTLYLGGNVREGESYHEGILDEIRISNIARSSEYINATYNTIENPNFLTIDTEQIIILADVYVDGDADPSWYDAMHVKTIQEGVDNANIGNTVYVFNGTYYENVVVDKTVNLIGEDKNSTIIDGGTSGDVVLINVDYVNISGFKIQNTGTYHNGGVHIESDYNHVYNNEITANCTDCIWLKYASYNTVSNNEIYDSWRGILIQYSTFNLIINNTISLMEDEGILIEYNPSHSYGNLFYHNSFYDNSISAWDYGDNTWDYGNVAGGNYWSDYDEPSEGAWDNNTDGIVDDPYFIPGESNQDNYPSMYPFGSSIPDFNKILNIGWNLIGWYREYETTASSISENITGCTSISKWDSINQTYDTYIVGGPPTFDFIVTRGMGLFVDVTAPSIWHGEG